MAIPQISNPMFPMNTSADLSYVQGAVLTTLLDCMVERNKLWLELGNELVTKNTDKSHKPTAKPAQTEPDDKKHLGKLAAGLTTVAAGIVAAFFVL